MSYGAITGTVTSGSDVALMARIRGSDGALLTQASISAVAWQATDLTAGAIAGAGSFTPSSVIFNTLVTADLRWTRDSADNLGALDGVWGYNFLAVLPYTTFAATALANVGQPTHRYQTDVVFTPVAGGQFTVVWIFAPVPIYL